MQRCRKKSPRSPTDEEIARHNETHLPYRAWCKVCVQGKVRQCGHKARPVEVTEKTLVQVDYCHMTCDDVPGKPNTCVFFPVAPQHHSHISPSQGWFLLNHCRSSRCRVTRQLASTHPRVGANIAANSCNWVALLVVAISIVPAHAVHFTIPSPCRETRRRLAAERRRRVPFLRSITWLRAAQLPPSVGVPRRRPRRLYGLGKLLGSVARACCVR